MILLWNFSSEYVKTAPHFLRALAHFRVGALYTKAFRARSIWWRWISNILFEEWANDSQFNQIKLSQAIYNFSSGKCQFNGMPTRVWWAEPKIGGWKWHQHKIFENTKIPFYSHNFYLLSLLFLFFAMYCVVFATRLRRGNFARIIIYVYFILFMPVNIICHRWSLAFCFCCGCCCCCWTHFFHSFFLSFSLFLTAAICCLHGCCQCHSNVQNFCMANTKTQKLLRTSMRNVNRLLFFLF